MSDLELHVLSGARPARVLEVRGGRATVGRSPEADLRFDPQRDLQVSALHAELFVRDGGWFVRDLGSRNGTWVDGARIESERPLGHASRIRFGAAGPEVEVRIRQETPTARIRALSRRNRRLTRALAGALLLGGVAGIALAWAWVGRDTALREESAALRSNLDSLMEASRRTIDALQGEMEGLSGALRESRTEVGRLRGTLDEAERDGEEADVEDLRRRLQAAEVALTRHQLAASLDFASIERANRSAVALVYVELEPGVVSTGTAFAVQANGTLLTNRHVVRPGREGEDPVRLGVQFTDSPQVWPGRVVRASPEADLALIRVDRLLGEVPTVAGFNPSADTLATGSPVAILGFPLGGEGPRPAAQGPVPRALLSAGVIQARRAGRLEILGYGEQGASGSPVLDAAGRVVGVVFGGRDDDGTRTLLAVPADDVLRFLGEGR